MADIVSLAQGALVRVWYVEEETETIFVKRSDGTTFRFQKVYDALPQIGDVLFLQNDGYDVCPADAWKADTRIALVRKVLEGGQVLVDDGLTLRTVLKPPMLELEEFNTVEVDEFDGILSVIDSKPLSSRDRQPSDFDPIKDSLVPPKADGLTFDDFGGFEHVKTRARELIETQLEQRQLLDEIGARPVRGVLFTGPPGTGKTHLARIVAQASGADFYLISGPSIVSKWVGDTEDNLRKIFQEAARSKEQRAIIFIDEIDSIAERRSEETHESSRRLVAQLLTLMDGFEDKDGAVVVIAATNRVAALDPALTRPGRFDWEIEFENPNFSDRLAILQVGAKRVKHSSDLPLNEIAQLTEGWSSAEVDSIWSEAALVAAGDQRCAISAEDIAQGLERVALRPRRDVEKVMPK